MLAGRENLVPRMLILLSRPRHAIMRHLVVARERLSPLLRLPCAELRQSILQQELGTQARHAAAHEVGLHLVRVVCELPRGPL